MPRADGEVRAEVARAEALLERVEALPDARARATAVDCVEALVRLYGEALARVMRHAEGTPLAGALADDELVSHLLLVHGVHPVDVGTRVARALAEVRPYLRSHGGNVELVEIRDGVARVRLAGSCHGCPSSRATLRAAIEDAVRRAAPDLDGVEAEGVTDAPAGAASAWAPAGTLAELPLGAPHLRTVAGRRLLFLRVPEAAYAYGDRCPACGADLTAATLADGALGCPACGRHYDVRGAGRCLDARGPGLEPVPLLVGAGGAVRVALPAEGAA
ncbi:MAG TPA: NifU family protein [Candidatus Binatia bacterium]|nr:NifU family protein [Candidatus Binatia bacterium]